MTEIRKEDGSENTGFWDFTGILKKYWKFWVHFWKLRLESYTCAKFKSHSKFPRKYRFFGILPIFWKNTGDFKCISENYAQNSILVPSFRAYIKFQQKYRFFGILPVFLKNARNSHMIFGFYDQNYPIPESFKEIGQFFSFSPKPVQTLLIGGLYYLFYCNFDIIGFSKVFN